MGTDPTYEQYSSFLLLAASIYDLQFASHENSKGIRRTVYEHDIYNDNKKNYMTQIVMYQV